MGTVKVTNIEPIADNGTVTLGSSGDTITAPNGTTVSGLLSSTPAFYVTRTASQSIADSTDTKVQFTNEVYDTDGAYDNSTNYRFTVPTGKGGKYYFSYGMYIESQADRKYHSMYLKVNGTTDNKTYFQATASGTAGNIPNGASVVDLSAGDYVEMFVVHNHGSSSNLNFNYTRFQGFRLIGV